MDILFSAILTVFSCSLGPAVTCGDNLKDTVGLVTPTPQDTPESEARYREQLRKVQQEQEELNKKRHPQQ